MKTKIVCPNKNDPAWKTLVDAIGEPRAYLTFFRNHNVIPDVVTARAILGLKETVEIAQPPSVPEPKSSALTLEQAPSKSKKPKATAPKKAPQFHGVVIPKVKREILQDFLGEHDSAAACFFCVLDRNRRLAGVSKSMRS
ncbi:MAG: hypothetical protein ABSB84_06370 [Verrucomicrobiota bacterium]